jgi:hypothetical protein
LVGYIIPNISYHPINKTLAGVAQLVERVALMTAKRSTSRSWVRAPPSAIPISSSEEQLFFCHFLPPFFPSFHILARGA